MSGTSAALLTTQLATWLPGDTPFRQLAYASAIVGSMVFALGFAASFWLPEPRQAKLPD